MKVLLVNGSPNEFGCTHTALTEIAGALKVAGVDSQIFHIGKDALSGCIACGFCRKEWKCVFDDKVNEFAKLSKEFDGFVFGGPVHYAAAGGALNSFMDRAFYSASVLFRGKPAATIVSCRRGGATAALDNLNKYLTISQMPIVTSQYWNMVHGHTPEQVKQDEEGMQTMRVLGNNMAWLLKCLEAGKIAGITLPEKEKRIMTNFIR